MAAHFVIVGGGDRAWNAAPLTAAAAKALHDELREMYDTRPGAKQCPPVFIRVVERPGTDRYGSPLASGAQAAK